MKLVSSLLGAGCLFALSVGGQSRVSQAGPEKHDFKRDYKIQTALTNGHSFSKPDEAYILGLAKSNTMTDWIYADMILFQAAELKLFSAPKLRAMIEEQSVETHPVGVLLGANTYSRVIHITKMARKVYQDTFQLIKRKNPARLDNEEKQFITGHPKSLEQMSAVCLLPSKRNLDRASFKWGVTHLKALIAKAQGTEKDYYQFLLRVYNRRNPG